VRYGAKNTRLTHSTLAMLAGRVGGQHFAFAHPTWLGFS